MHNLQNLSKLFFISCYWQELNEVQEKLNKEKALTQDLGKAAAKLQAMLKKTQTALNAEKETVAKLKMTNGASEGVSRKKDWVHYVWMKVRDECLDHLNWQTGVKSFKQMQRIVLSFYPLDNCHPDILKPGLGLAVGFG